MSEDLIELKITGWSYKGFKTPDVDIEIKDNDNGNRNFTLYQMLSGEGKTTTLKLLRNSFYDINNKFNKSEIKNIIEEIKSDNTELNEGIFEVKFKLNNKTNYRINVTYDYINNEVEYNTIVGDGSGYEEGLILPESITRFVTPEFINITFFDLELTDGLYEAQRQQTDKIIKKLCKLDYLDEVSNSLEVFLKNFRKKNQGKLQGADLQKREKDFEKLKKHYNEVIEKSERQYDRRSSLKKRIKELSDKIEKIKKEDKDLTDKIKHATEVLENKNDNLREALKESFNILKNPMIANNKIREELINFEDNLNKNGIPKSVGEAFFMDLTTKYENCLCGHPMTDDMRKNIEKNKYMFLEEENLKIISPIKASINKFDNTENYNPDDVFNSLIKHEREINIAKNEYDQITKGSENEELSGLSVLLDKAKTELEEIENWIKNTFEKPYNPKDSNDTDCKKTLEKRISNLENEINERTGALKESKKINKLKDWLKDIQKISLDEISLSIIEDINKEVDRVLPLEKIYVESIKNKITLKKKDGSSREKASRGQMARIAYLFLINLLNRPNLKFPFIVDSPVTTFDRIGRSEIAKGLVKDHNGQYIGFIFDTEREHFSEVLEKELSDNINLITVFNKSEAANHMTDLAESHQVDVNKFDNGVVVYGKNFFNKFSGVKEN